MQKSHKKFLIGIFVIASGLRLFLGLINYEANDYHFEVIDKIIKEKKLPAADSCDVCFHPKLYHVVAAGILKFLPPLATRNQIRTAQIINCLAGIGVIYVVYLFLIQNPFLTSKLKLVCFSLVALNPKLIGINAQATNDTFVILFSTLSLYFLYHFLLAKRPKYFFYLTLFAILGALSKPNGFYLFAGIILVFLIEMFKRKNFSLSLRKGYCGYLIIFLIVFLFTVLPLGQYLSNYLTYGSLFLVNTPKKPFPDFLKDTYVHRPGVTSIVKAYFTFRFIDLIKHPVITSYDNQHYTPHRTSLWSQLYGRTHFVHFDSWPPSWRTTDEIVWNLGRTIFVLALLPTFFLLTGLIMRMGTLATIAVGLKTHSLPNPNDWIFDIFFFIAIAGIIVYTAQYRDFGCMKAVFIFPALLAFVHYISYGSHFVYTRLAKYRKLIFLFDNILASLVVLYCLDVICLIVQLYGKVQG